MRWKPIILYKGQKFTVEFATNANGISECELFFNNLDKEQKTKILRVIKKYADRGIVRSREQFKKLEGDLWEFKSFQTRIIMFHCATGVIAMTNGLIKKSGKTPPEQIKKANRIKKEYDSIRKEARHE